MSPKIKQLIISYTHSKNHEPLEPKNVIGTHEQKNLLEAVTKAHNHQQALFKILWLLPERSIKMQISSRTSKQVELIQCVKNGEYVTFDDWESAFSRIKIKPAKELAMLLSGILAVELATEIISLRRRYA